MSLSEVDKAFVLNIKYDDITYELIEGTFCNHYDMHTKQLIKPRISFQEEFDLKKGEYINTEKVHTNVGQYILNVALYGNCPNIQKVLGYVAKPYTKSVVNETEAILIKNMMDGKISTEEYIKYLNNIQWFGNSFNAHVASSFTPSTCKLLPSVKKRRDELYKQHKEELDKGDVITSIKISDELLKIAKDELKDNVGMQVYDSECKPKMGNVYRTMFISRGPVKNTAENKFDISRGCYIEGMAKDDIKIYGNSVINGAYPKAIGTAIAGYETKKLFARYQPMTLAPKGSDCGSKMYREVTITKKNKDKLIKRYYLKGNKLEILDDKTLNSLIGKTIKIRSPLYCREKDGKICNKCIGDVPYILGVDNVGLTSSAIGSGLLNLLMKSFHDSTQKFKTIDINRMIIE